MPRKILFLNAALLFLILSGCSSVSMTQLMGKGKQPLSQSDLAVLIPNAIIHLESIDFNGEVHFLTDGQINGKNRTGTIEKGKWEINKDNQLCMKFTHWYYGDLRCYLIFQDNDQTYIFFTTNGARFFTGRLQSKPSTLNSQENISQPGKIYSPSIAGKTRVSPHISEEQSAIDTKSPKLSEEEIKISLQYLARNCPGCNLSGQNLQNAHLVEANLTGANLVKTDLSGANLHRANLVGANLTDARLIRTNLSEANLSNCNLSGSDLTDSNLVRTNVTDANLEGSRMSGALLQGIKGLKK